MEVLPGTATWDAEEDLSLMKRTRQVWVEKSKDFENKWKNLGHHLEIKTIQLAAAWICSIVERRLKMVSNGTSFAYYVVEDCSRM